MLEKDQARNWYQKNKKKTKKNKSRYNIINGVS